MKSWRDSFRSELFVLPVILIVSLSLVCLGMRTPTSLQAQKPKERPRAVFETRAKAIKVLIEKNVQNVDLNACTDFLVNPVPFYIYNYHDDSSNSSSITAFSVTLRAPPVLPV